MPLSVHNTVGRLFEVRVVPPVAMDEATVFMQQIVELTIKQPGKVVACTDLRAGSRTIDPSSIDFIAGIIRAENPRLERNALVVSSLAPTFTLQMERMVKVSGAGAARRVFKARGEAEAWLGEVLGDGEKARLRLFLDEHGS